MSDRITAAQPGSPAEHLWVLVDGIVISDWVGDHLAVVLEALDLVHDAASTAATSGHPLDPAAVLACLDEALGTVQVRSSSHVGEGT